MGKKKMTIYYPDIPVHRKGLTPARDLRSFCIRWKQKYFFGKKIKFKK
jgi:hypothetical protein